MPGTVDKGPADFRLRFDSEHERTVERMAGRQDMDYGAVIGVIGLGVVVIGALMSLFVPPFAIFVLGGVVAMLVGAGKFVKGVIRVRSTR